MALSSCLSPHLGFLVIHSSLFPFTFLSYALFRRFLSSSSSTSSIIFHCLRVLHLSSLSFSLHHRMHLFCSHGS
ncbi:hypothetical protein CPB83DRAFT_539663 [Crepidotus variabilis]|uniref:Uncharacterized protein n=1 Tax=Crepidotus variabilis TaxID=179855 RepID=A0A9P6EQU4_9AGAR|nr:hypothetical protein CPB83DRAFT_539663 [Crepidotus variabilis]